MHAQFKVSGGVAGNEPAGARGGRGMASLGRVY
jgi:hypothetical protein